MLEPEGKILLLKTSPVHALTVGRGEVKLGVNWELPTLWLIEGSMSPAFLLGYGP